MAETNSDDRPVTDEDFKKLKDDAEGVEAAKPDEPQDQPQASDSADDTEEPSDDQIEAAAEASSDESSDEPTFTKKFPNLKGDSADEYVPHLETAYENSTAEALKWKKLYEDKAGVPGTQNQEEAEDTLPKSVAELYAEQKMQQEITEAWTDFSKDFTEINDADQYDRFVKRVATLSKAILDDEQRLATPQELYSTAAASLGWKSQAVPSDDEKLGMAVKDNAATSKSNNISKTVPKSKVTDKDVTIFRKLNPTSELSDQEIRKELEPHK